MGIFDKIESAKVTQAGNYIQPGKYLATIVAVKSTQNHAGAEFVAIEMRVDEVLDAIEPFTTTDGKVAKSHKAGEDVTHLLKFTGNTSFLPNFKQFLTKALDCHEDEITKEVSYKVTSDENPLAGVQVIVNAMPIKTRANKDFTKVIYDTPDAPADAAAA